MLKWLEITADYQCNNRCLGCFSVAAPASEGQPAGPTMAMREILENLQIGRKRGARGLWLGGGEPTLRKDLLAVISTARRLGYDRIKLQTNGMLLAYPDFIRRLVDAGLTEVNFSIKGSTAEIHDRYAGTPGCHKLMLTAMDHARRLKLGMEADVLVYKGNAADLPDMVRVYTPLGVGRYVLWLLSLVDANAASASPLAAELPRISEIVPHIVAAMDLKLSDRPDFITSLHTPPCTIPPTHHACLMPTAEWGLLVTNPGGFRFMLEESPIEGGVFFDRCQTCKYRPRCSGARRDYVAIHGDAEFQPPM